MSAVAIIGGSPDSFWTVHAIANIERFGYTGEIAIVSRSRTEVNGRTTYKSLRDVPGDLDAALVAVSRANANAVVEELDQRGCQDVVVITDGYGERGAAGQLQQDTLVKASGSIARLLGPNCVGFADFSRGLCLIAEPIPADIQPGAVSVISQSGAIVSALLSALLTDSIGVDWACSIGNAAKFDLPAALEYVADRGTTRTVCLYAESLGTDIRRLTAALDVCAANGVAIVALVPGKSERSREAALSHTGSVVGTHEHTKAFLERRGAYLVNTLSELARVTALVGLRAGHDLAQTPISPAIVGSSGGSAILASEAMDRHQVELRSMTPATHEAIKSMVAEGSFLHNPMDIIGKPGQKDAIDSIYGHLFADDAFNLIVHPWPVQYPDESPGMRTHRDTFERIARTASSVGKPTLISSVVNFPMTEWVRSYRLRHPQVQVLPDLELTASALGIIAEHDRCTAPTTGGWLGSGSAGGSQGPGHVVICGEAEGRELLRPSGLPLVEGVSTAHLDEVEALAARMDPPYVVKISSAGVVHKASAGLVRMNVCSAVDAARVARSMADRASLAPGTFNILVQETFAGREVLCSWTRSSMGLFLTIGMGGGGPMDARRYRMLALPVSRGGLEDAIRRMSLVPEGAPLDALVGVVADATRVFAETLASTCQLLELNPVIVSSSGARIVDVLVHRWKDGNGVG